MDRAPEDHPAATSPPPDFWRNLRQELATGRQWVDRAIVLAYAVATGLVVVGFTLLSEAASELHDHGRRADGPLGGWGPWLALVWTPALTVAVLWLTRRLAPAAMGSGIPQVVAALDDAVDEQRRGGLVSLRVSLHKIWLVAGGLLAGLSIGREGPTVQVGAGVMLHARRWLSPGAGIDAHDLMVAGAAAGIAAAFNTPLGGIIFALEQLTRRRNLTHSSLVIIAIVTAGLVAVAFFGNVTYFGRLAVQQLDRGLFGPGLLVALVTGLAGGLFSRLIVVSMQGLPDRFSRWRRAHPLRFAAGCALGVAVIALVTNGATAGAVAGDRRRHRPRHRAADRRRRRTRDPADRARHGRLPRRDDAGADHRVHHRDGDGGRPRDGAQPDGHRAAGQRRRAAADAADVPRARGAARAAAGAAACAADGPLNRRPGAPARPSAGRDAARRRPVTCATLPPMPAVAPPEAPAAAPLAVLHEVFGYAAFRGPQQAIVEHVVNGGDALVLMPTGGGKSLCYQVPAIVRHRAGHGVAVVVSPLIALMHDQVGALEEAGVHAAFLNSTLSVEEAQAVERELRSGRLVLLYAAPERVLTPRLLAMLDALHERGRLSLFAIDEAHCVSQWGHDFREEYLGLSVLAERYAGVPRLALTATADATTRADIVERLQLERARTFVSSFDRPNIRYTIVEKDDPRRQLLRFLRDEHDGDAGIVYCQSRRKVEEVAAWLAGEGVAALPYHAGLDAETRRAHQDRFLRDEGLVMVATIAFGMGIDKPDVRFVAHLDLPKNIEAYYQETGRAGRDGLSADAWMTYGLADVVNQRRMIDDSAADDEFKRLQRDKLDALLALCEATDCRRVRLLAYFGEPSQACGNCDNCLNPPETWDATEAARKALSCVYRFAQHGRGFGSDAFGAGHLVDVLRGKLTDKVRQHGHERLSTFGVGADLGEAQWRAVLRQLIALGHLRAEGEYHTLALTDSSRAVLRGEVTLRLRRPSAAPSRAKAPRRGAKEHAPPLPLDAGALARFAALKAWRAEVAREHGLPAYVIFHDATLAEMAREAPATLDALAGISGVGAKKLDAYGREILRVLAAAG